MTDELAKGAADVASPHLLASRAAARCEARERAHAAWATESKMNPVTGRFATADRLPRKEEPYKYFQARSSGTSHTMFNGAWKYR